MNRNVELKDLLFSVSEAPVHATVTRGGVERRVAIPEKKALIHAVTGQVLGVVGRSYHVVTNQEAINLGLEVCKHVFPGVIATDWKPNRARAPKTLSFALIDLVHCTHVLNYLGVGGKEEDPYTPFIRVTNSFNRARALRFDFGFMRMHCTNGVVFEEEVATITASHDSASIESILVNARTRSMENLWQEFSGFLDLIKGVEMSREQSRAAIDAVIHLPVLREPDSEVRRGDVQELEDDILGRVDGYRRELGGNAYAAFNSMTDIAARPPSLRCFQKDCNMIERQAGRWLRGLSKECMQAGFKLDKFNQEFSEGRLERPRQYGRN